MLRLAPSKTRNENVTLQSSDYRTSHFESFALQTLFIVPFWKSFSSGTDPTPQEVGPFPM